MTHTSPPPRLRFREVDPTTWKDLEQLFEARGGPKNCWCMVWRATPAESHHTDGPSRKAALKRRVDAGTPVGIIGYQGEEPVAWCSIAPRSAYRRLGEVEPDGDENIWSLVCFYVKRQLRGQKVLPELIEAAVQHASQKGATIVEAYPVDPDSPSYRFMGFVETFHAAGFEETGRVGTRRHILRKRIGEIEQR